jgi:hypothetical protein
MADWTRNLNEQNGMGQPWLMRSLHRPIEPVYCGVVSRQGGQGDTGRGSPYRRADTGRAAKRGLGGNVGGMTVP